MDCKAVVRHLHEYLDGELTAEVAQSLERHLKQCEHCQRFLQSYRKTIQLFQRALDYDPPRDAGQKILRSLERKIKR